MAFTVTPTSGVGPYTLSANIANSLFIDGVNFFASIRTTSQVGSCPSSGSGSIVDQFLTDELIGTGSTVSSLSTPSGSCRAYTLRIFRVIDNAVVAIATARVDNT